MAPTSTELSKAESEETKSAAIAVTQHRMRKRRALDFPHVRNEAANVRSAKQPTEMAATITPQAVFIERPNV